AEVGTPPAAPPAHGWPWSWYRAGAALHGGLVLHVVVQGFVDIADGAGGERDERKPVIVVLGSGSIGERQSHRQQVSPEQHRRSRDGVGDQERSEVLVIVAPTVPERVAQ